MRMNNLGIALLGPALIAGCDGTDGSGRPPTPSLKSVINVSLRSSLLYPSTSVLQITNTSRTPLPNLLMRFRNLDSQQFKYHKIDRIDSGEKTEVGMLEAGWAFEP